MTNRKKRLKKGIESLKKQIEFHREKQKQAEESGDEDLVDYFECEIGGLIKTKEKKEDIFDKN
jgi:hypothetical protein